MPEWWTYSLSDFLLFSPQTYYRLYELHNLALWPLHIVFLLLGIAILALLHRGGARQGRIAAAILAAVWLWVAWTFLFQRYATINWAATYFAAGFAIETLLLIHSGVIRHRFSLRPARSRIERVGLGIFLFSLVGYPFIAPLLGRPWTQAEVFGVAPDPTVMATLGIVLSAFSRPSWLLLAIPVVWCLLSGATLWAMESAAALVLPVTGLLVLSLAIWRRLRSA